MENETQINGILSPFLQRLRIKQALPHVSTMRVLDIGCSTGELLAHLPSTVDYIGIEGNTIYFNNAVKANPERMFYNLYVDGDNIKSLDIPERDSIVMLAILEHLDHPVETLRNLKDILSPDGNVILTTPGYFAEYILKVGSKLRLFSNEMHEHKDHFKKHELMQICKDAGFDVVKYHRFELGLNHFAVLRKAADN